MKRRNGHPHLACGNRRGNTMVLVTGILVLLVIIATAFVTRTNAQRDTATAVRQSETRDATSHTIANSLAYEVGISLFPLPVDQDFFAIGTVANSNVPRLSPHRNPIRYGIDQDANLDGEPDHPYNFAPFHVTPWTNWLDPTPLDPSWPTQDPTAFGAVGLNLNTLFGIGVGNPPGGPGFGDTRWLRDNEPLRWDTNGDGIAEAYSHWRHLTNLARPNNGFVPLVDISDVGSSASWFLNDATGGNGPIYHIPIEQWLPIFTSGGDLATGNANYAATFSDPDDFRDLWLQWFSPGYVNLYANIGRAPHNRYWLQELGSTDQEFAAGSDRWSVSRTLADSDGDGYTDSFWFLPPTPVVNGVRTVIAVSVIDNQGMLNATVATRFAPNDGVAGPAMLRKTRGLVPSDLALFGDLLLPLANPSPLLQRYVGFYDNPDHDYQKFPPYATPDYFNLGYNRLRWERHTLETGMGVSGAQFTPNLADRLDYWQRAGRHGLAQSDIGYTPFTLSDEIELRMFAGQNYPWIHSRYENSVQSEGEIISGSGPFAVHGLLRSGLGFEESNEYLDQRINRMLVADQRHRLTLYNNVRNDIMPPWLWRDQFPVDSDSSGFIESDERLAFEMGRRKFDLRGRHDYSLLYQNTNPGVDALGAASTDRAVAREVVRDINERALMDDPVNPAGPGQTYFGDPAAMVSAGVTAEKATRLAAAGLAANLDAWRDEDDSIDLREAVVVNDPDDSETYQSRMLPLEAQPFIAEVFIAHVYSGSDVPDTPDPNGDPYTNSSEYVVFDDDQTTIVVVQLVNPFDRAIDLRNYKLSVFGDGNELDFNNVPASVNTVLQPGTEDDPATAIIFAAEAIVNGDNIKERWLDFMDIEEMAGDPVTPSPSANTLLFDLTDILGTGGFSPFTNPWSTDRDDYTTPTAPSGVQAVVLKRVIPTAGTPVDVVVDRLDNPSNQEFRDEVLTGGDPNFGNKPSPLDIVIRNPDGTYPAYSLGLDINGQPYTHWVQYFRATRAWGFDINDNGAIDPAERNPRYVFGDLAIATAEQSAPVGGNGTPHGKFDNGGQAGIAGAKYDFRVSPDTTPGPGALNGWFGRTYHTSISTDTTPDIAIDKPTFFNMRHTGGAGEVPDKGWYGQEDDVDTPPIDTNGNYRTRLAFAMQMMQKDADIEQVGELMNIFMFGHEIRFEAVFGGGVVFSTSKNDGTERTFSEFMADPGLVGAWDETNPALLDLEAIRVNRLRTRPLPHPSGFEFGAVIGAGDPADPADFRHRQAALPGGLRLLDGFVCDGRGINPAPDLDLDGFADGVRDRELAHLFNANGFTGRGTPGLINAGTASPEVFRALPHMYRLVHEVNAPNLNPRVMIPEAMVMYRDGTPGDPNHPTASQWVTNNTVVTPGMAPPPTGPYHYGNRQVLLDGNVMNDIRSDRGIACIGELLLVNRSAPNFSQDPVHGFQLEAELWKIDLNSRWNNYSPFVDGGGNAQSVRISTDVNTEEDALGTPLPDDIAKDAEEANLLFAGISNLITQRSDAFTVYFRVRSFRQNPNTLVWDATDPEYIVDDSRYVMLVDRSEVNHPNDRPKILYMEKLPN